MQSGQQECIWDVAVAEHNKYRRHHGCPDVRGNQQMHTDAQKWAEFLASSNRFEPTTMGKYGNNLASSFKQNKADAIRDAIKRWYDDKDAGFFHAIVAGNTTDIGIGLAWNAVDQRWIINAFYFPPVRR